MTPQTGPLCFSQQLLTGNAKINKGEQNVCGFYLFIFEYLKYAVSLTHTHTYTHKPVLKVKLKSTLKSLKNRLYTAFPKNIP